MSTYYDFPRDLDLYIQKKVLLTSLRPHSDLPILFSSLSFYKNSVEVICRSIWDLYAFGIVEFDLYLNPEDLIVDAGKKFWKPVAFNWELIQKIDGGTYGEAGDVETFGLSLDVINRKKLREIVDGEINEFINDEVVVKKRSKKMNAEAEVLAPDYLTNTKQNFYSYNKQRTTILNHIYKLYKDLDRDCIVFNSKEDFVGKEHVDWLRTFLALEKEGYLYIFELENDRKSIADEDEVYIKFKLADRFFTELKIALNTPRDEEDLLEDERNLTDIDTERIAYEVTYNGKREIMINSVLLAHPDFESANDRAFAFIFNHPNQKISKQEISAYYKGDFKKDLNDVLSDLGFKGKLKELFFPNSSKDAVEFVNPITNDRLEMSEFKHLKNIDIEELISNRKKKK